MCVCCWWFGWVWLLVGGGIKQELRIGEYCHKQSPTAVKEKKLLGWGVKVIGIVMGLIANGFFNADFTGSIRLTQSIRAERRNQKFVGQL